MQRRDIALTAMLAAVIVLGAQMLFTGFMSRSMADNTTTPTKVNTFVAGNLIRASELNTDFDDLYTGLRNVGTANLLDNAITTTKIADLQVTNGKLEAAVQNGLSPTGSLESFIGSTAPTGWILASGLTMGDASSGGTGRANADTSALFIVLWNAMADAQAPVSTGRGGSAAADFAAHKTITLPDLRGRALAGLDNMGGSAANRITSGGAGFDGTVLGNAGGSQTHTLTTAELAAHNHAITITDPGHNHAHTDPGHNHTLTDPGHLHQQNLGGGANIAGGGSGAVGGGASNTLANTTGITIAPSTTGIVNVSAATGISASSSNTGSGNAHSVTQPTYVLSIIIKL